MKRGGKAPKAAGAHGAGSRDALLAAAALQDQLARRLRMPGGPSTLPSFQPGAKLTLAQHLGLIDKPPPLLTEEEWTEVHLKSRCRQDSASVCAVCYDEFRDAAQVLLSCSHTFHKACLASFERYARSKVCPLCRCQQYQKRLIHDGEQAYRHKCATRIQAAVRGHLARKRYRELRRHNPPKDERLKKKWAAERLQEESDKMLADIDDDRGDLDAFFAELDASVAQSRAACDAVLQPLVRRMQEQQQEELQQQQQQHAEAGAGPGRRGRPDAPERGGGGADADAEAQPPLTITPYRLLESSLFAPVLLTHQQQRPGTGQEVDWEAVVAKAKARGHCECPICLRDLTHTAKRGNQGVAWLSCTHCFHLDCIVAFEAFELGSGGKPTCPVCRSEYRRRCLT